MILDIEAQRGWKPGDYAKLDDAQKMAVQAHWHAQHLIGGGIHG